MGFWVITPCNTVDLFSRLGGKFCLCSSVWIWDGRLGVWVTVGIRSLRGFWPIKAAEIENLLSFGYWSICMKTIVRVFNLSALFLHKTAALGTRNNTAVPSVCNTPNFTKKFQFPPLSALVVGALIWFFKLKETIETLWQPWWYLDYLEMLLIRLLCIHVLL
jgi:hypothetical protein